MLKKPLALLALAALMAPAYATDYPITPQQRTTAQQVAQAGVPLAELAPGAPDLYTVRRGDTLWDISKLYLRSPWRWPELWGMNLDAVRNPHLIYPGQMLVLEKANGRARLRVGQPVGDGTERLSPRVREQALADVPLLALPRRLLAPFLTEAVVFEADALADAPVVVAGAEARVLMGRGQSAYVRGNVGDVRQWQIFRTPKPLVDPATGEVLGYEARHVGYADVSRLGGSGSDAEGNPTIIPATVVLGDLREEVNAGDRLAPAISREVGAYAPHAAPADASGQIISVYGDSLHAGVTQIVSINRGSANGVEPGHMLAIWTKGQTRVDPADGAQLVLPDERKGTLFVFRVFDRVAYGLVVQAALDVQPGDRLSAP